MGANSSKKQILEELKNSVDDKNRYNQNYPRIECKNNYIIDKDDEKNSDEPFDFSFENRGDINNNELDIKNIKIFPYSAIGTISVQFPISDEIYVYTCFSIDTNVVVTLASNIDNKNKGGKAKSIVTSFSKENVKWENIFIQEEEEIKLNNVKGGDKKINKNLNNFSSKLAAIIYDDQVIKECLGAEIRKKKEYDEYYEYGEYYEYDEYYKYDEPKKYAVFSLKRENNNIISIDGKENNSQIKLREIIIENKNPFLDAYKKGDKKDIELICQSPGSPIYHKNSIDSAYAIAIITENFEFQYFDNNSMEFLINMIYKGKQFRKKLNDNIDVDNIYKLNLEEHNLGPLDINYLINNFELKNLKILDLHSNSLKAKGAFYLSQNKFSSLEFLNLSDNRIGDEGLHHIANGFFNKLNILHLTHNFITSEGIKYLIKAEFINNLKILSLSENRKIGDIGIRYMKEHKGWNGLKKLNLDLTGLTDVGLDYLTRASMPKLKKLNIHDNTFTDYGKSSINALRMNHIKVSYRPGTQKEDDYDDFDDEDENDSGIIYHNYYIEIKPKK